MDFDSLIVGSNPAGPAIKQLKEAKASFFIGGFKAVYKLLKIH
jgi:hypothetical protein